MAVYKPLPTGHLSRRSILAARFGSETERAAIVRMIACAHLWQDATELFLNPKSASRSSNFQESRHA
jgi:hypothetical protein